MESREISVLICIYIHNLLISARQLCILSTYDLVPFEPCDRMFLFQQGNDHLFRFFCFVMAEGLKWPLLPLILQLRNSAVEKVKARIELFVCFSMQLCFSGSRTAVLEPLNLQYRDCPFLEKK